MTPPPLSPELAAAKAKLGKKKWRSLVKSAHAKGYTVAGALSGAPDPLKERTKRSLREEAAKTVAQAYKPAEDDVTRQDSRIRALDAKRAADERYYQQWLQGELGKLHTQATAADQGLRAQQANLQEELRRTWTDAQAQAQANAGAAAGNVSNPGQSTALNFAPEAQRANERLIAQRQETENIIGNREAKLNSQATNAMLAGAAQTAKRQGDTWASLEKVGDAKLKLSEDKKADLIKEVARLIDRESDKADANRNFSAAAERLGIQQAGLDLRAQQVTASKDQKRADFIARYGVSPERYRAMSVEERLKLKAKWTKAGKTPPKGSTSNNYGYDAAQWSKMTPEQRRRAKAKWDAAGKSGKDTGPNAGEKKQSSGNYQRVETAKGEIQRLHAKNANPRNIRQRLREKGFSDVEIDIAEDLRRNNGKLSARGKQKAKAIGILNPEELWGLV